jgi:4'-phosphopantetheinyl transferase
MVTGVTTRLMARRRAPAHPRVWVLDLAHPCWDIDAALRCLSPAELRRAEGAVERVRRRRILLRAGLRRVAGQLVDKAPEALEIADHGGRPVLVGHDLQLSCSAHGDVGLLAVADGPIGVDVAGVPNEDLATAVAEGWLASEEARAVADLPVERQPAALARCWAQKEAVLKAEGVGLARHPATVLTPLAEHGVCGSWWLTAVPVPSGHLATVATRATRDYTSRPVLTVQGLLPGGSG